MDVTLQRADGLDADAHRVWLCREDLGPLGSFKWRGADAHCEHLRDAGASGVVAASTGNFAAAVARAAGRVGLDAHVVVPASASIAKLERLDALGAHVHRRGDSLAAAVEHARTIARTHGFDYFEDGGSQHQLDGIATLGRALGERWHGAAVIVPVACGALAAGVALGLRAAGSTATVIGVQIRACSRLAARWHGEPEPASRPTATIADGLADDRIVEPAFGTCRARLGDLHVVDEDDLRDAMRALHGAVGSLPEPAGAAALAGLRRHPGHVPAGDVAVLVSGANVAPALAALILDGAAGAAS